MTEAVDWHPFETSWEREFQWASVGPTFAKYFPAAIALAAAYVVLVFAGQRWMKSRPAYELDGALIYWNLFLTVLSWAMALRMVPALIRRVSSWTLAQTICDATFIDGTTGFWVFVFTASKIPELLDTAFLVLRKRSVILLHWYHHFTVLLYTWYAFSIQMPAGLWFCAMNSLIHAFMYFYYYETARGKKPTWNIYLTIAQITQMVVGSYLTARDLLSSEQCAPRITTYTGVIMYFSYFCLFVHLFYTSYVKKGGRSKKGGGRAAAAPGVTTTTTTKSTTPDNTAATTHGAAAATLTAKDATAAANQPPPTTNGHSHEKLS